MRSAIGPASRIDRPNYNGTSPSAATSAILGVPILPAAAIRPLSLTRAARQTIGVPTPITVLDRARIVLTFHLRRGGIRPGRRRLLPHLTVSPVRGPNSARTQTHVAVHRAGIAWALSDDAARRCVQASVSSIQILQPWCPTSCGAGRANCVVDRPRPAVPDTCRPQRGDDANGAPNLTIPLLHLDGQRRSANRSHLFASVGYTWKRGVDLLRTRVVSDRRRHREWACARADSQFESTDDRSAHEIHLTASGNIRSWLSVFGSYQWADALQDTDGPYTIPASSSNLAAEWGPAQVPRHQVAAGASFALPGQISISPVVRALSALPFNITTGMDNNRDTQFADRPAVAQPGDPGAVVTPYGVFNPSPVPGQIIIPRNSGVGPTEFTLDLSASWSSLPSGDAIAPRSPSPSTT